MTLDHTALVRIWSYTIHCSNDMNDFYFSSISASEDEYPIEESGYVHSRNEMVMYSAVSASRQQVANALSFHDQGNDYSDLL